MLRVHTIKKQLVVPIETMIVPLLKYALTTGSTQNPSIQGEGNGEIVAVDILDPEEMLSAAH